jgi:hypothetical protein
MIRGPGSGSLNHAEGGNINPQRLIAEPLMFSNYFRFQGIADMAELAAGSTRSRMTHSVINEVSFAALHGAVLHRIRSASKAKIKSVPISCLARKTLTRRALVSAAFGDVRPHSTAITARGRDGVRHTRNHWERRVQPTAATHVYFRSAWQLFRLGAGNDIPQKGDSTRYVAQCHQIVARRRFAK